MDNPDLPAAAVPILLTGESTYETARRVDSLQVDLSSDDLDRDEDVMVSGADALDGGWLTELMLALEEVDGLVAGAEHTTADTVRPSLQVVGTAPGRTGCRRCSSRTSTPADGRGCSAARWTRPTSR